MYISWNKTRNPDEIIWNVSGKHGINFLVHGFVQKLEPYFICRHTKHASLASTVNILFIANTTRLEQNVEAVILIKL